MYKQRRILAVIPARGGSKGLPGKNIRPLLGKPLIAWSIEQALASRHVDKIFVSTDSLAIAATAARFGVAVPFLRPGALATDKATTIDALRHVVDRLAKGGERFDYLLLLEPTSPLRAKGDIDRAIKQLVDHEAQADSLVTLGEVHMEHPAIVKKIAKGRVAPYVAAARKVTRRQDLDKAYFPYGVVYLSKMAALMKTGTFYQKKVMPFFIQRWQNYEVDDVYDFACIEAILKERSGGK